MKFILFKGKALNKQINKKQDDFRVLSVIKIIKSIMELIGILAKVIILY